jgi:hypothetical protein
MASLFHSAKALADWLFSCAINFLVILKNDLKFYLENLGSEPIIVHSTIVTPSQIADRPDECFLKTKDLTIIFMRNCRPLSRIRTKTQFDELQLLLKEDSKTL